MTCVCTFAQSTAMPTQLTRVVRWDNNREQKLRMSWVVVTDNDGQRQLRIQWEMSQGRHSDSDRNHCFPLID